MVIIYLLIYILNLLIHMISKKDIRYLDKMAIPTPFYAHIMRMIDLVTIFVETLR